MKLRKAAKILLSCLMAGALLTGCGGDGSSKEDSSNMVKLGMISHLNATENKMNEIYRQFVEKAKIHIVNYQIKYFESLNQMQMGIESGNVDQISLYASVAKYLVATNDKFKLVDGNMPEKIMSDNFCFAIRKEDTSLKADLDKVIGEMKSDGSLDKLVTEYITNADKGKVPPAIDIPKVEGAPTIKVGVTGDLPPLDYVSADGSAAGFNTALLAEVGKRLNRNVEIVQIESGARSSALAAKQIDVVFWAVVPNADILKDIDKPVGLEFSESYFKDSVAHVELKN